MKKPGLDKPYVLAQRLRAYARRREAERPGGEMHIEWVNMMLLVADTLRDLGKQQEDMQLRLNLVEAQIKIHDVLDHKSPYDAGARYRPPAGKWQA